MKVCAKDATQRMDYAVFVDGADISACCYEADDIAHEAYIYVRDRGGRAIHRPDGGLLKAIVRGHVAIVRMPKVEP